MTPKTEKLGKEEHAESSKTISGYIENPILEVIEDARREDARRFRGTYLAQVVTEKPFYFRSEMHKVNKKESPTKTV